MNEKIGRYEVLELIGKGGMGEVWLAFDPVCGRKIALKKIRSDLKEHQAIRHRFLREAQITAHLTHPGTISVFSIHQEKEDIYYTMPYVEGDSLKQILRDAALLKGVKGSIASLLPIFRTVCQTVSYAHSKGILHRDLKPENILVGKFGEVILLDWGLAQMIQDQHEELNIECKEIEPHLTIPGKLVGTVSYMAPERANGAQASVATDVYALGVILYQILTLHLPFKRSSLKEFQKNLSLEKLLDPEESAPYREVPPSLSALVKRALHPAPHERYQTVESILDDLKNHMEGRSEWFEAGVLNIHQKKDWEFHENVLIAKHAALTRTLEAADWVSVMVSKASFAEKTRIEATLRIGLDGAGIGFLLSVPDAAKRDLPLEGYCLWLGTDENQGVSLFRNTIEVLHKPSVALKQGKWHQLVIEKVDLTIHVSLDGKELLSYVSYLPLFGNHLGILAQDDHFELKPMLVSVGGQSLRVSCLSIPDAFLASKDYDRALSEYRRIGNSFPGHTEGREALFRAGITVLEKARTAKSSKQMEANYSLALEEFAKLHNTPGAPLEYLGKAIVYQSLRDHLEEIKCLELGLRRYAKHPLSDALRQQIIYRMHEASQTDRRSAYQLILIVLRLLPDRVPSEDAKRLFTYLIHHWEPLFFFESGIDSSSVGKEKPSEIRFAATLAFWLAAPYTLLEIYQELAIIEPFDAVLLGDLIYSLFELGSFSLARQIMDEAAALKSKLPYNQGQAIHQTLESLTPLWICHSESLTKALESTNLDFRALNYLMQQALKSDQEPCVFELAKRIKVPLSREDQIRLDANLIWAHLKRKEIDETSRIFDSYPLELLNQEGTLLHPLFGCFLLLTEGEEIAKIHFSGVIDTPFPRSWALLSHELTNKITESIAWYSTSFMWERRQLYRQMALYYCCAENPDLEAYYRHLESEEYISIPE